MRQQVCLDLTPNEMHDRHGGIGRYALYLLAELVKLVDEEPSGIELSALLRSAERPVPAREVDPAEVLRAAEVSPRRHRVQRRLATGPLLTAAGIDLFHATQVVALPFAPRTKVVVTAYDLISIVQPKAVSGLRGQAAHHLKRVRERLRYRRADHIIAISRRTQDDLQRVAAVPDSQVTVVHLGVDLTRFQPRAPEGEAAEVRRRYDLPERFLLAVGSDHYRKNHQRLFDAWCLLAKESPDGLVIVGKTLYERTLHEIQAKVQALGLGARFRWLSEVTDDELPSLYRQASAYIAPSLYEGFGMTLLEAMACGAPVVAARNGAYEEVAQDAALLFDPLSTEDLAARLREVLLAPARREQLRAAGLRRAATATWREAARQTLAVYRRVLER